MAKFHGPIGYAQSVETSPGVFTDQITEREYYGDVIRESRQWIASSQLNDNLTVNNRISIVSDDFANSNFSAMKYVIWSGVYWKISNVEIQRPRLILSLGGVYNGVKA
jgi:hypothetical protein